MAETSAHDRFRIPEGWSTTDYLATLHILEFIGDRGLDDPRIRSHLDWGIDVPAIRAESWYGGADALLAIAHNLYNGEPVDLAGQLGRLGLAHLHCALEAIGIRIGLPPVWRSPEAIVNELASHALTPFAAEQAEHVAATLGVDLVEVEAFRTVCAAAYDHAAGRAAAEGV